MTGSRAIDDTMAVVMIPLTESPMKMSAPSSASSSVRSPVSTAKGVLYSFIPSSRPLYITPRESHRMTLSGFAPRRCRWRAVEIADAPAPLKTTRTASMRLPTRSMALRSAAAAMMAVPCWSSWKTGMSSDFRRARSMTKHSGAAMSSRLMPATVGLSISQKRMTSCASLESTSMSNTSMPAKRLKSTALPSITGLAARGPMLPSPSTAVPLETTATRFPRAV